MEQFDLNCFLQLACSESTKLFPSLYSLTGQQHRLLPMAVCRDPPAPQELILLKLCRASLSRVNWRGNASSSPPRWLWAILYTNFFSLWRFCILIPSIHKLLLDQHCAAKILESHPTCVIWEMWAMPCLLGCLLCSPVLVILWSPAGINTYKKASSQ